MSLTLKIIKSTSFPQLYKRFLLNEELTSNDYIKMLELAIIFINSEDVCVKRLGYRIIVIYSNRTNDYAPLYEISINKGLYPIAKFIESRHFENNEKTFFTEINSAFLELYKSKDKYCSEQQYQLNLFYSSKQDNSLSIVAPTSYGKTELILETLKACPNKNICIITPTKSLLAQTRNRILNEKIAGIKKIIVHPEMYIRNESNCIAVLTQERLLRLLKIDKNLHFDYVIVDEAHNLLYNTQRDELLASSIIILNKRNPKTAFKFLTPFIKNTKNLKIRYTSYDLNDYVIDEYIKTEKVFFYDIKTGANLMLYDQYIDEWCEINSESKRYTSVQFISEHSADKNIVFFTKPRDIESFAQKMIDSLPDVETSPQLKSAIENISEYLNPEYTLVKCLRKGIVYHHSAVPDTIRLYVEHLYSSCPEIKYIITNSTLLEGVNIPASKLFVMDNRAGQRNLSASSFKNLIGRICRFSEVFNKANGSMKKLEPEIYFVSDGYFKKNANIKKYISKVLKVDNEIEERTENILLENTDITSQNASSLTQASEFLENYEPGSVSGYKGRYAETSFGQTCILNGLNEMDIFNFEFEMQDTLNKWTTHFTMASNENDLIDLICNVFIPFISNNNHNDNILRLKNETAQNYYKMLLSWKLDKMTYKQMIEHTIGYWETLKNSNQDTLVYVGQKWGDTNRGVGYSKLWTDIKLKNKSQLINLAIVRIKEEQDFIDNSIMKFVEVLNDMNAVNQSLYRKIKYGTDNPWEIVLIKNGFSLALSKLLLERYNDCVSIDMESDTVKIDQTVIEMMKANHENQILIYEAQTNVI